MTTLLIATRNAHKVSEIRAGLGDPFDLLHEPQRAKPNEPVRFPHHPQSLSPTGEREEASSVSRSPSGLGANARIFPEILTLDDFPGAPKTIEDARTFAGNATKKATELATWLSSTHHSPLATRHFFVLADDSGLEVDALDSAPGVLSARFAATDSNHNSSDTDNNEKLLRLLQNVPAEKRAARFRCVLALTPLPPPKIESASPVCYANESELQTQLFEGVCEGEIIFEPRGANGFGYDPLFAPEGFEKTFAELGHAVKNQISHRARALGKLKEFLKSAI